VWSNKSAGRGAERVHARRGPPHPGRVAPPVVHHARLGNENTRR
jgi:hypothetical protein